MNTERHQHRRRAKVSEKSPISLARLAVQNFNDLQRTSRYAQSLEPEAQKQGRALERSPRQHKIFKKQESNVSPQLRLECLPKLTGDNRLRWVSLDASASAQSAKRPVGDRSQLFQFNVPDSQRLRQRVSLDYQKLEQIVKHRQHQKNQASTQDKILNLVQQLQPTLPKVPRAERSFVTETSKIDSVREMFKTQTMWSSIDASKNQQAHTMTSFNQQRTCGSLGDVDSVPANFTYPETNMRLTCNYFGANDYSRKKTIDDIKERVIEERSTQRNSKLYKGGGTQGLRTNLLLTDSATEKSWPSKLQEASLVRNETAQRPGQDSKMTEEKTETRTESQIKTPDGCKGVQIDSQIDKSDTVDSLYKQIDMGQLDIASSDSLEQQTGANNITIDQSINKPVIRIEQSSPHRIQLSTHLFNGDYLVQSLHDSNLTVNKTGSQRSSHPKVPQQILQEQKQFVKASDAQLRQKKVQSKTGKATQQRSPRGEDHSPNVTHQVNYYAGPQINQINLHVHFSNDGSGSRATVSNNDPWPTVNTDHQYTHHQQSQPVKNVMQDGGVTDIAKQVQANLSKLESDSYNAKSHNPLNDQASKHTLNQSSSKALQLNNAQQSHGESPFELRQLNKYSSLQAANQNGQGGLKTRLERFRNQNNKHQSSDELSNTFKIEAQPTVLGVNLNSGQSNRSSEKATIMDSRTGGEQRSQKLSPERQESQVTSSNQDQKNSSIHQLRSNQNRRQNSQMSSPKKRTTEVQAHVESPVDPAYLVEEAGDKQQAEQMINEILHRLTQQQQPATIKITTHKNEQNKSPPSTIESQIEPQTPLLAAQVPASNMMSSVKQHKMRSWLKPKASPSKGPVDQKVFNQASPMMQKQLNLYKLMVQKFEEEKSTGTFAKGLHNLHSAHKQPYFNTISDGFCTNSFDKQIRSTTIAHGEMQNMDKDEFQSAFKPKPYMSRTIMAEARSNPWASFDANVSPTRGVDNHLNPNTTGFSILTSHLDRISSLGNVNARQMKDLQADLHLRPFSLESKPEQVAHHNGQSSVLFRVNPLGEIGRFRPRPKRQKESFGERNTRLGNIATRTCAGIIRGRMQCKSFQSPAILHNEDQFVDTSEGYLVSPAMLDTRTSAGFEKKSMEREIKDLEQAMIPSTDEIGSPWPKSSRRTNEAPMDQVIYEEVTDDCNADLDDVESHISGVLSTIVTQPTSRIRDLLGHSTQGPQVESVPLQRKLTLRSSRSKSPQQHKIMRTKPIRLDEIKGVRNENASLLDIAGHLNQRISMDQSLLEKIKQIQSQQNRNIPQNKSPQKPGPGQLKSPQKLLTKPINKSKDSSRGVVQQIMLGSKAVQQYMTNQKISSNEVLEGHSIMTLRHEQVWSGMRPPDQAERTQATIPMGLGSIRNIVGSRVNKSHLVVVQTPDATSHTIEEVKERLEIKIRVPSQLLSPEVIRAINGKLDLQISLIYFDGSVDLGKIQQGTCPWFVKKNVFFNQQGFAINSDVSGGQALTKWNLYDHCFRGQVNLDDLNFTKRQYIVEIELLDSQTKSIYLLRYLTFNHMSQATYPKIFITIMQYLSSKKRPLHIFDGLASEVLDFTKEPTLKHGMDPLNMLFEKLVMKDFNSSVSYKKKPFVDCPPIRMRGIILESPKRKVQIKGLSEFISINDGSITVKKKISSNVNSLRKEGGTNSRFRTISRETLRPDHSDSQYVAVQVTNHELQARNLHHLGVGDTNENGRQSLMRSALSKTHTSSTMHFGGAGSPRDKSSSPLPPSFSRTLPQSPLAEHNKSSTIQLNYDSAKKIVLPDDPQNTALNSSMQVTKITEHRQQSKTPTRKQTKQGHDQKPPTINKQQFHIDPNLEKGIDCSFEALGSSEGRHSANASSPPESVKSKMRKVKRLHRYSHSAVGGVELDEAALRSTKNLHYGSNTSEQEDDQGLDGGFGTFGPNDRLQSIFTMNKKESDLQDYQARGSQKGQQLIIRGSSKEMMTMPVAKGMPLKTTFSKEKEKKKQKEFKQAESNSVEKETFKLPSKGILNAGRTVVQGLDYEQQQDLEQQTSIASSSMLQHHDAAITANFDRIRSDSKVGKSDMMTSITRTPRGSASKRQQMSVNKKEALQKSIVNLNAEDVIKEAAEPAKHRSSGLAQLTKKTMPRRSNLRHALADEKSKLMLQQQQQQQQTNPLTMTNLTIQKKELQETAPRTVLKPRRQVTDQAAMQKELSQVDSEVVSIRRSSMASQFQVLNPKLQELGGHGVVIVQKSQRPHDNRQISFERAGKQIDIKIISSEQILDKDDHNSSQGNGSSSSDRQ